MGPFYVWIEAEKRGPLTDDPQQISGVQIAQKRFEANSARRASPTHPSPARAVLHDVEIRLLIGCYNSKFP